MAASSRLSRESSGRRTLTNKYSATDLNPGPRYYALPHPAEVDQDRLFLLIHRAHPGKNKGNALFNPATDYLTISFGGNAQLKRVKIWDAGGLVARSTTWRANWICGFEPGVYPAGGKIIRENSTRIIS